MHLEVTVQTVVTDFVFEKETYKARDTARRRDRETYGEERRERKEERDRDVEREYFSIL